MKNKCLSCVVYSRKPHCICEARSKRLFLPLLTLLLSHLSAHLTRDSFEGLVAALTWRAVIVKLALSLHLRVHHA